MTVGGLSALLPTPSFCLAVVPFLGLAYLGPCLREVQRGSGGLRAEADEFVPQALEARGGPRWAESGPPFYIFLPGLRMCHGQGQGLRNP